MNWQALALAAINAIVSEAETQLGTAKTSGATPAATSLQSGVSNLLTIVQKVLSAL